MAAGKRQEEDQADLGSFFGPLEALVMEDLWRSGSGSVAEVLARVAPAWSGQLQYPSVLGVLERLEAKGLLTHSRESRAHRFMPALGRDEFIAYRLRAESTVLVQRFGKMAVAGFVEAARGTPELLAELRRLARGDGGQP